RAPHWLTAVKNRHRLPRGDAKMNWQDRPVLVTGGASFIGSSLVDKLVCLGARVRVVDDLISGRVEHIQAHIDAKTMEFIQGALREAGVAGRAEIGRAHV